MRYHTFIFLLSISSVSAQTAIKLKSEVSNYIDHHASSLIALNDSIWKFAEPALHEKKSSTLLADFLQKEGFKIERGVGGFPTQFLATYGDAKPVIGLFGEYDADPKASNNKVPYKEELSPNGYGHGAGHNLLGVGSLGAAMAMKSLIEKGKLKCTIKYFGTTDEGGIGGKTYLARDGFFDDLDVSLYWHPSPVTKATTTGWDALFDLKVMFSKGSDENNNVLDAVEKLLPKLHSLRENINNGRINYIITSGGKNLRSKPDSASLEIRIHCAKQSDAVSTLEQVKEMIHLSASESDVQSHVEVKRALHQFVINTTAMRLVHKNMEALGPIKYTEDEQGYAKKMQQFLKLPEDGIKEIVLPYADDSKKEKMFGYASDIGDASWFAPEAYFVVCIIPQVPMHSWPTTAFTAHSIAHKGMLYAAKVLSFFMIDYVRDKKIQNEIRNEFELKTGGYRYTSFISPKTIH